MHHKSRFSTQAQRGQRDERELARFLPILGSLRTGIEMLIAEQFCHRADLVVTLSSPEADELCSSLINMGAKTS